MYHSTGVQKLSETQKSKLRNGHPVRIKKGSGNNWFVCFYCHLKIYCGPSSETMQSPE